MKKRIILLVAIMFLTSGCWIHSLQSKNSGIDNTTETVEGESTFFLESSTSEEKATPSSIVTQTHTVTPTFTVVPTQTITWTPNPTLSKQDAGKLVLDLIKNNGNCRLPCWWGLTPGGTTWIEAKQFLATFVSSIEQGEGGIFSEDGKNYYYATNYSVHYEIPGYPDGAGALFNVSNGIISSIEFGYKIPDNFQLHNLLEDYGQPGKVFLQTYSNAPFYPWPFRVILYYPDNHFIAFFEMDAQEQGDILLGCPQKIYPSLSLFSADRIMPDQDIEAWTISPDSTNQLKEIGEASELSIEDFYNIYLNPNASECIETPKGIWP